MDTERIPEFKFESEIAEFFEVGLPRTVQKVLD